MAYFADEILWHVRCKGVIATSMAKRVVPRVCGRHFVRLKGMSLILCHDVIGMPIASESLHFSFKFKFEDKTFIPGRNEYQQLQQLLLV